MAVIVKVSKKDAKSLLETDLFSGLELIDPETNLVSPEEEVRLNRVKEEREKLEFLFKWIEEGPEEIRFGYSWSEDPFWEKEKKDLYSYKKPESSCKKICLEWLPSGYLGVIKGYEVDKGWLVWGCDPWGIESVVLLLRD
jgi:hypothetical protein